MILEIKKLANVNHIKFGKLFSLARKLAQG